MQEQLYEYFTQRMRNLHKSCIRINVYENEFCSRLMNEPEFQKNKLSENKTLVYGTNR